MKYPLPALAFCLLSVAVWAEEPKAWRFRWDDKIPVQTNGGLWFWGDVLFFHDWHIQKNVVFDKYRLIDGDDTQRALGSYEDCLETLEKIKTEEGLNPMEGKVLILLHGFGGSSHRMRPLADWFKERGEYDHVLAVTYPSTQQAILDHTRMLDGIVKQLPQTVTQIDFIGHSLGSIVIRRYLSGPLDDSWRAPEDRLAARKLFSPDRRIGRFVMLGPPNHGAELATKLIGESSFRRSVTGASGDELGLHWSRTELTLGIPCCPFGIVSGGRGDEEGINPLIPGDDDGIVSVEGTRLEGAEEWIQYRLHHGNLLFSKDVFEVTERFLKTGSFVDRSLKPEK